MHQIALHYVSEYNKLNPLCLFLNELGQVLSEKYLNATKITVVICNFIDRT